ncbi:hypothetical protein HMPREF0518_2074, partial [Lactobacillus helveticus DSM 20075 = CGMCC 1.1877]
LDVLFAFLDNFGLEMDDDDGATMIATIILKIKITATIISTQNHQRLCKGFFFFSSIVLTPNFT